MPRHTVRLGSTAVLLAFSCLCIDAQDSGSLRRRIEARLAAATAAKDHPRLFADAPGFPAPSGSGGAAETALRERFAGDPLLLASLERVRRRAEVVRAAPPVERVQTGRRLLGVSRTCLARVVHLAYAYRAFGDARDLRRAEAEMLAVSRFTDWNPSHFLDVAEMTAALAIGYDWLHADLDPTARTTIRDAIVDKGLRPSRAGGWWVTTSNNWNQVCHGGLALGALAVAEDEPALTAEILERAVSNLPRAMREYGPDGAYPEGPAYWVYGTSYNVLLLGALRSTLGTDFGLVAGAEGFLRSATYYLHATGPTGAYFNYSDCGRGGGVAPAMAWFAAARGEDWLLWHERCALATLLEGPPPDAGRSARLFPFLLLWAEPTPAPPAPAALHFRAGGTTPVAMHRTGWDPDAVFVGVKAGSPAANHGHMDVGSFVMAADGVRWAVDLGAQNYHSLESAGIDELWSPRQDSQRWTVFRLNNLAHNTLVVGDDRLQVAAARAPIVLSAGPSDDPAAPPRTVVDLGPLYAGQLAAAKRGVALHGRSVRIQDELQAPAARATTVRWGMVTRAEVAEHGARSFVLEQAGERLEVRILEPAVVRTEVVDTATPRRPHDAPNPGTRMVAFHVELPESSPSPRRLVVDLVPGSARGPQRRPAPVVPLARW